MLKNTFLGVSVIVLSLGTIGPSFAQAVEKRGHIEADKVHLDDKLRGYAAKKDTANLIKYTMKRYEKYGLDTVGFGRANINNFVFYILFKHSTDRTVLKKGLAWMEVIMKVEPDFAPYLDTYANLLYKLGDKRSALKIQKRAVEQSPDDVEIKENLQKMLDDIQTW